MTPSTPRRRRLIDALADQSVHETRASSHTSRGERFATDQDELSSQAHSTVDGQDARSQLTENRPGTTPTSRKVKFTYSQTRSTTSERYKQIDNTDTSGPNTEESLSKSEAQDFATPLAPPTTDKDGEEEEEGQPAIRSVHELRRAGANNRSADEMDDLLARVGKPGSCTLTMRRNALCELATRLRGEGFARQFRDHASRDNMVKGIGQEEDLVSGFALAAGLIIFLQSFPAPNLIRQLVQEGLASFLGRLLKVVEDINTIAAWRKSNVSRATQNSIQGVKKILVQLPIWHALNPVRISPRTVSLQLIDIVMRCSDGQLLGQMGEGFKQDFATVAANCAEAGFDAEVDDTLLVFALESLSNAGVFPGGGGAGGWIERHQAVIAKLLLAVMQCVPRNQGKLEAAILRLAIDASNTEEGAAAFENANILAILTDRILEGFKRTQEELKKNRMDDDTYDGLLLMLGFVINIVEHRPLARVRIGDEALDRLARVWEENQRCTSEVGVATGRVRFVEAITPSY